MQNQPGTIDEYPNWRVPLSGPDGQPVWLEDVLTDRRARDLLRVVGALTYGWTAAGLCRRAREGRQRPPMTPFSTALVTASASAWVSVPSLTAASSLVFGSAARSA